MRRVWVVQEADLRMRIHRAVVSCQARHGMRHACVVPRRPCPTVDLAVECPALSSSRVADWWSRIAKLAVCAVTDMEAAVVLVASPHSPRRTRRRGSTLRPTRQPDTRRSDWRPRATLRSPSVLCQCSEWTRVHPPIRGYPRLLDAPHATQNAAVFSSYSTGSVCGRKHLCV